MRSNRQDGALVQLLKVLDYSKWVSKVLVRMGVLVIEVAQRVGIRFVLQGLSSAPPLLAQLALAAGIRGKVLCPLLASFSASGGH